MGRLTEILARTTRIDRRWIFLVLTLATVLPFLSPIRFSARPSEETLRFQAGMKRVVASDKPVLFCLDYGTQTLAEMEPIALALMHELFAAKKKVVFLTLFPEGAALLRRYLAAMEVEHHLRYGEDYVFLGYATAYTLAIYNMGTSIEEYFKADDRGTPTRDIPLMRNVEKLADVSAVIDVASNNMPQHWVTYAVTPFHVDFLMACTAVQATDYFPYLQTGQVKGLLAGGRAGAELEGLLVEEGVLRAPGDATRGLGSQSLAIVVIAGFIVLGNVGYFAGRALGKKRGGP